MSQQVRIISVLYLPVGNPFPPLQDGATDRRHLLHNVLLDEARRHYRHKKYQELAAAAAGSAVASSHVSTESGVSSDVSTESVASSDVSTEAVASSDVSTESTPRPAGG